MASQWGVVVLDTAHETQRVCPLRGHAHCGSKSYTQVTSRTRKSTRKNTDDREQKGLRREPQKERNVPPVSHAVEKFGLLLLQKFLLLVFTLPRVLQAVLYFPRCGPRDT